MEETDFECSEKYFNMEKTVRNCYGGAAGSLYVISG
jgi:hypothetical protein